VPGDHVDHLDPVPLHAQLADILRRAITSGQYQPRDPLPSESQLMGEHGVARGTVRQAIETLRTEGLVVTIRGRGTYVAPK
jgi:DNA-binding GntR family transcriptional regulator